MRDRHASRAAENGRAERNRQAEGTRRADEGPRIKGGRHPRPAPRADAAPHADATPDVAAAYTARADEYAGLLGSVEAMAPEDRALIARFADDVAGPVCDVGCGPGHWAGFIAERGHRVLGYDPSPRFVEIARRAHPQAEFLLGDVAALAEAPGRYGGVLAWYSLIHLRPPHLPAALETLADALAPGGRLLLGFFDGDDVEPFPHAVTTAYRWPRERLARLVEAAGLEVLEVGHRVPKGARPHASVLAAAPGRAADPDEAVATGGAVDPGERGEPRTRGGHGWRGRRRRS
ncbi:class I SAM-dependent methyltransferase [Rothia sp. AR01]|uniref:Class I SAM-dependent methyltransferase n=1 Tax=Rothia santali TaxID=2949643 RepID=A0A9X2HC71_9MICC|nr:class I SAM-dependent methyltransferase [Rothia santali]MCP3426959.1 class I SAM-dependent methyltransferase [Rothia santali]